MISTGQPFQDVCTKSPKWFRRVKELFRADVARRHIRPCRGAFLSELAHFPRKLFTLWRQRGRRRPPRQLQPGPAQRSRTLQSGPVGNAALPELAAALLRPRRPTARLRHARLRRAGRICRRSGLERRLIGRAGLLRLTRPRRQSRLWRTRLLQSLPGLADRVAAADPAAVAPPAGSARGVVAAAAVARAGSEVLAAAARPDGSVPANRFAAAGHRADPAGRTGSAGSDSQSPGSRGGRRAVRRTRAGQEFASSAPGAQNPDRAPPSVV